MNPYYNKYMTVNISLVSKKYHSMLYLQRNKMWLNNTMLPVKVYYIVKNKDYDSTKENYENLINNVTQPYILYVDNHLLSGNMIFETDIIKIFRKMPYVKLYYRKISPEVIKDWINNDNLVEIFCLDNDNTIHSIYKITELGESELKDEYASYINDDKDNQDFNNFQKDSDDEEYFDYLDKDSQVGKRVLIKRIHNMKSTYFKNELLSVLQKLFTEDIVMNNVFIREFKYI